MESRPLHPETRAIRSGRADNGAALAPTLVTSTTFEMPSLDDGRRMAHSTRATQFYGRHGNPTVAAFEQAVADLEGAEAARAFSSGMGAVFCVVFGLCSTGDHIVAQRQLYGGTMQLLAGAVPTLRHRRHVRRRHRRRVRSRRPCIPGRTMLVLAETPANPRLDLVDLDELGAIAGPDHRRRLDASRRRSGRTRWPTASTSWSTRRPRRSAATTTRRSAWSPASAT